MDIEQKEMSKYKKYKGVPMRKQSRYAVTYTKKKKSKKVKKKQTSEWLIDYVSEIKAKKERYEKQANSIPVLLKLK